MDNLFDAVHKPEFERLLRAHLAGKMPYRDSAWYALRNVVYATGCRIYRSQSPTANFAEVEREARSYFSNALSVRNELLLMKPSLRSVRAFLAMVSGARRVRYSVIFRLIGTAPGYICRRSSKPRAFSQLELECSVTCSLARTPPQAYDG